MVSGKEAGEGIRALILGIYQLGGARLDKEKLRGAIKDERFPRSAAYDPEWMIKNEMGPSAVWLMEFLTEAVELKPGMKVLDMGCGKAISSIFLAREFGVQVWATDLWISASDNLERIQEAGVEDRVFPIHAEAHALPYARDFFDAIVSADAYHYFGTSELYLHYFIRFLKPGGQIGIVVPGLKKEFSDGVPEKLEPYWESEFFTFHSPAWWKELWNRSGLLDVEVADDMPDGWEVWLKWENLARESGLWSREGDVGLLEADKGEYLGFTRVVGRRR